MKEHIGVSPTPDPGKRCIDRIRRFQLSQEKTTLKRIRDTKDALASAQVAMDKAQAGLSGMESVVENVDKVRRHPMTTVAIVFALGLAATLTFMGMRSSDD